MYIFLLTFVLLTVHGDDTVQRAATDLSIKFSQFKNDIIGVDYIQDLMNKVTFKQTTTDGEQIINQFSKSLADAFKNRFEAVRNLKKKAEELYARNGFDNSATKDECCKIDPRTLEYSSEFRKHIGQDICYRISKDSKANPFIPVSNELKDVMQKNKQLEPSIKWQYFGTEEGTHVIYPKKINNVCDSYDPRYRPWYVETVTPVPKDIVIVFDKSGSMEGQRLAISKEAAITVVGTLNPNDRVALVVFSTNARTPPGDETESCYANQMAFAIPSVKRFFRNYIADFKEAEGTTSYVKALTKAFEMLQTVQSTSTRRKVILFLTDGEPDEPRGVILQTLSSLNAQQKNSVTILTYGLGNDIKETEATLLKEMATMKVYNATAGDRNLGHYVSINDTKFLRYRLASYYNYFATRENLNSPIVSVPYTDFSGLGTVTSICLPVYDPKNNLKGAVCVDITIGDLTVDLETFYTGENSYVFIIDNTGRPLLHPQLPSPGQHYSSDPIFLDITVLEADANRYKILDQMINVNSTVTQKQIQTHVLIYKGNASYDATDKKQITAMYYWRKVSGTRFVVCLVQDISEKTISIQNKMTVDSFLYHKLDLQTNVRKCNHLGRDVTTDQSAVMLSPNAFVNIYSYIYTNEEASDVKRYEGIMEGWNLASQNPFKTDVVNHVAISAGMDEFWKGKKKSLYSAVKQFYFASYTGVFRMFPGQEMPQSYNHLRSNWYIKALAFKNTLVISGPTMSDFGQKHTYTASHTVLQARKSLGNHVEGVIAADFDVIYLEVLLHQALPACAAGKYVCFLFDSSGFIVYHPSVNRTSSANYHLAAQEPDILDFLMRQGHIQQSTCVDFAWKTTYHTWKVNINSPIDERSKYPHIFVAKIQGTNLYVCLKNKTAFKNTLCESCRSNEVIRCTRNYVSNCHCPCYNIIKFRHCTNSFIETKHPACLVTQITLNKVPSTSVSKTTCFSFKCIDFGDKWTCILNSCQWCKQVVSDDNGRCMEKSECPTLGGNQSESGGVPVVAIAVPIVLVFIVAIVVVVVIFIVRKPHLFLRADEEPQYTDVAPGLGQSSSESSSSGMTLATSTVNDYTGMQNAGYDRTETAIVTSPNVSVQEISERSIYLHTITGGPVPHPRPPQPEVKGISLQRSVVSNVNIPPKSTEDTGHCSTSQSKNDDYVSPSTSDVNEPVNTQTI